MENLDPKTAAFLSNLSSGALGGILVLAIQSLKEWRDRSLENEKTAKTIYAYLQNILLRGVQKLPSSYTHAIANFDQFLVGRNPREVTSDYNKSRLWISEKSKLYDVYKRFAELRFTGTIRFIG